MLVKNHREHPKGNLSYLMASGFTAAESTFSAVSSRAGEEITEESLMSKKSEWDGEEGGNGVASSDRHERHTPGHRAPGPRRPEFAVSFMRISNAPRQQNRTLARFLVPGHG